MQHINRWRTLPLSLAGWINLFKMNVLPWFLYLYQCIPILIPKPHIGPNTICINMGWQGPHIRRTRPNFLLYYWASNVQKVIMWANSGADVEPPAWVKLESFKRQLHSLGTAPLPLHSGSFDNPVVAHILNIWVQFWNNFGLQSASLQAPILSNHLFTPSKSYLAFRAWHSN